MISLDQQLAAQRSMALDGLFDGWQQLACIVPVASDAALLSPAAVTRYDASPAPPIAPRARALWLDVAPYTIYLI